MKTISRIIIILLAATLIGGITYAIGNSNWGTAQPVFNGRGGERFDRAADPAGRSTRTDQRGLRPDRWESGRSGFDRDGGRGFGFLGGFGLARTIVPIALMIGVVLLAANGLGRFFNRRKGESAPVAATAAADVAALEATPADTVNADVTLPDATPIDATPTDVTLTAITPTDATTTDVTSTNIMTTDIASIDTVPPETPPADDQSTRS